MKMMFLNWLVNSTDFGLPAVHLQEENDMTSKRRKLQYMLLPVNLAGHLPYLTQQFCCKLQVRRKVLRWSSISIIFILYQDRVFMIEWFLTIFWASWQNTLFLKEGKCIISKEFAPKITKHSKIIVWAILRTIYLTSIDWKLLSKYLFAYSSRT